MIAHGVLGLADAKRLEVRKWERFNKRRRGARALSLSRSVVGFINIMDDVGNRLLSCRQGNSKGVISNGSATSASSRFVM